MTDFTAKALATLIESALADDTSALLIAAQLNSSITEDMMDTASDLIDEDLIVIPFFQGGSVVWIAVGTDAHGAWTMFTVAMRELINQSTPALHNALLEMSEAIRRMVSDGEGAALEPITAPVRH